MKRIMLFAAACIALAACTKEQQQGNVPVPFEKGQTVTLTASAASSTKVTSSLDGATGAINFKWESGDKIKVSVGTESAEFSLKSGAGTSSATFEGTMPASGDNFDVQYPVSDPDLSAQTYSSTEAIPHDKMKFTATGCTLGTAFELNPCLAALRLNLYGLNREVSQIVITNTTSTASPKPAYTLSCNTAVRVGNSSSSATPFFIVLPSGDASWNFEAKVTSLAATQSLDPLPEYDEGLGYSGNGIIIPNNSFSTSSAKTFAAGQVLDMPAKSITIIWAPVNCGYEAANGDYKGYPYGRMYQWGRKYGQGYHCDDDSYVDADYPGKEGGAQTTSSVVQASYPDGDSYNGCFYITGTVNWYSGSNPDKLWNVNEGTVNPVSKSAYDPCPAGWRVPTKSDLDVLLAAKDSYVSDKDITGTGSGTYNGYLFGTAPQVFLPYSGYLNNTTGKGTRRNNTFGYWSSTADNSGKSYAIFVAKGMGIGPNPRATGRSVRCVKEY